MANKNRPSVVSQEHAMYIGIIKRRLDLLDQRLDNIDSVVTAVAERVMNQPITLNVTCPHCGNNIEIAILGSGKPRK